MLEARGRSLCRCKSLAYGQYRPPSAEFIPWHFASAIDVVSVSFLSGLAVFLRVSTVVLAGLVLRTSGASYLIRAFETASIPLLAPESGVGCGNAG